jgi:hypothetical protein
MSYKKHVVQNAKNKDEKSLANEMKLKSAVCYFKKKTLKNGYKRGNKTM